MYLIAKRNPKDNKLTFITRSWSHFWDTDKFEGVGYTRDLNKARYFRRMCDVVQSIAYRKLMTIPGSAVLKYDLNSIRYMDVQEENFNGNRINIGGHISKSNH